MTAERMEVIETSSSAWKADIIAVILHSQFSIPEIPVCRCIGFLSFNKPAGLILLKLVKLRGASVIWLYSSETGVMDVQSSTLSIV